MEKNDLKNIVVLKNLPSNIVDEAIVILKPNQKIKKIEVVDKNRNISIKKSKNNMHVINEAEMLVNDYICKLEKQKEKEVTTIVLNEKYKRLKKYTIVLSIVLIMSIILHFV